ncbi:MAG: beta-galactosidase trimerization domain-containing protein [Planctomycetota bacterium]
MTLRRFEIHFSILAISITVLTLAGSGCRSKAEGIFSLEKTAETKAYWRGEPLIVKDNINYLGEDGFAKTSKVRTKRENGWEIVNTISNAEKLQYRKEVGLKNDRIELNIQMNLPSYENKDEMPNMTYSFFVPLELLINTKWHAITGRSHTPKKAQGQITPDTPNGSLVGTTAKWIAFESKDKHIVFDLNPKGVSSYSDFGPGVVQSLWNIIKTDEYIQFSFGGRAGNYGGVFLSKVVILEGTDKDYKSRHSQESYHYYNHLAAKYQFSFGSAKPAESTKAVDTRLYDKTTGYGWKKTEGLKLLTSDSESIVMNAVTSSQDNTLICDIDQPGLYIVTLCCSGAETNAGPFSVISNNELKAKNVTVKKGKIKTITYSQWLEKGTFNLALKGKWLISSVALQMLLHKEEDFAFKRGYWIDGNEYEPTVVNSGTLYSKPVDYKVAISEIDIPETIIEPKHIPPMTRKEIALPDQKGPAMAWRHNAFIGGIGTGNNSTFLEFETPEKISRRITKLKAMGINTIIINGFLARHCHREHLPRIKNKLKQIAQIAHKMGVRVLDHQDLTIMWNRETALRTMIKQIDFCQRTIDGYLPNQSRCPLNPDFQKEYFAYIMDLIDETNIDGLMLDEVCFHGEDFCGCQYCRNLFTEETGLVLPVDEKSPVIKNRDSILWKTWLRWRLKAIGDWWVSMRKAIQQDHPDFCIMGYISEGGFQSNWASLSFGYDLIGMARSNDFLGTEIMARNVMDNCRYVFSSRKMYSLLREAYDSPVFGLVYPLKNETFAYFGWAMNNMNAQATWSFLTSSAKGEDTKKYINFSDNMDKMAAEPVSEIALLFSIKSRDWQKWAEHYHDVLGICQILTDNHIQHSIISEINLTVEDLKKYRLLVLPSACCLSDKEIAILYQYAKSGGHLLITGHTGTLDEIGNTRKKWAFADMMDAEISTDFDSFEDGGELTTADGKLSAIFSEPILKLTHNKRKKPEPLINIIDKNGSILTSAAVAVPFGTGRAFYCAPRLGAINYQKVCRPIGAKWTFALNKPIAQMLINLIHHCLSDKPLKFEAKQIPEKVFVTVYNQDSNGRKSALVHLLNATGVKIEKGDTLKDHKSKPAFPPITADMVFEIELAKLTESYAASPDYKGRQPVTTKKLDKNRYEVTVPKELLKAYTIVYLHEN